jgi:hypothetical protein
MQYCLALLVHEQSPEMIDNLFNDGEHKKAIAYQ